MKKGKFVLQKHRNWISTINIFFLIKVSLFSNAKDNTLFKKKKIY